MLKKIVAAAALLALATPAMAFDIEFPTDLSRPAFRKVTKEAGAALSFHKSAPATPLGITGFDAGVEVTAVDLDQNEWTEVIGDKAPNFLYVPRLHARKGLPFGIDLGAMYAYIPDSDMKLVGVEASKAVIEGGVAMPALAVRASWSKLLGVKQWELQTVGLDATLSKGFIFLTPYIGAGAIYTESKARLEGVADISASVWQPRYFGGVELKPFPLFRILGEVEYAQRPMYTLKAAIGF